MIDKLNLRIPEFAPPGPALAAPLEQLRRHPVSLFRPSRYYQSVADLRETLGIDAFVHLHCRYGRPNHKLEIIDAGEKTVGEMAEIAMQLFDVDPWTLAVMRIDLAADIEDISVQWFKENSYVDRKQFSSRIDKSFELEMQFVAMVNALAQTIYAGKRPDMIRIYDKLAEWRMQLRRIAREYNRFNKHMEGMEMSAEQEYYGPLYVPTFEEYCKKQGYEYKVGQILTRIEREISGIKISPEIATLGHLLNAHELNPFSGMHIIPGQARSFDLLPPDDSPIRNWLAALGYETLKERTGSAQVARQIMLKHGRGNGKRILDSLTECSTSIRQSITDEDIRESFRRSTLLQTSTSSRGDVHLSPTYDNTKQIA